MTLKIEMTSDRARTTVRLVGRMQAEHLEEVGKEIRRSRTQVVLDLADVTLVDVEVVRYLGMCQSRGIEVVHCSPYIREWIVRELDASE